MLRSTTLRQFASMTALAMAVSITGATSPAAAASKRATHVKALATPATVLRGGAVAVTGSLTPKTATAVLLQRLVGTTWTTVAHAKPSRTGTYVLTLRAPNKTVTLTLRVSRAASATATAGVSATLHVRVVKAAFHITAQAAASVSTAHPVVVSGKVSPKGKGSVSLDRRAGSRWVSLARTRLTAGSGYSFSRTLPAGSYTLRVSKPLTTSVAAGVSKAFTVVVEAVTLPTAPPTTPGIVLPVVSTTSLTGATVGVAFRQTLVATSGTAPYTWSVASGSLPTGLSLLPSGVVLGTPLSVATFSLTVRATDALGHSGTGSITALVHAVGVRAWGYGIDGEYGDGTMVSTFSIATATIPGTTVTVAAGNGFVLALQADGTVYAWGANSEGQLGLGDTTNRSLPTLITTISHITAIAAGVDAAYAVSSSGALYSWGNNAVGQLGNGTTSMAPTLTPAVRTLANVVSVAAGSSFALALTGNGVVYGWGDGQHGVIGDGNNTPQVPTPTRASLSLPDQVVVTALSATSTASYALLSDGTVQAWGLKEHGELGNANLTGAGTTQPTPAAVTGLTGVTSLSCTGFEFCLALRSDHTVYAWGNSNAGDLGNGQSTTDSATAAAVPGLTDVTAIATAHSTGYALHADGTVSSWGYDNSNELGNGDHTVTNTSSPAQIPGLTGAVGVAAGSMNGYALQAH